MYALGDFANIPSGSDDALPQLGSVAQQAGDWAAQNILAAWRASSSSPSITRTRNHGDDRPEGGVAEVGEHRHELHGRIAFAWPAHAQLLANAGAEVKAFLAWADETCGRTIACGLHHRPVRLLPVDRLERPHRRRSRSNADRGLLGDDHVAAGVA